MACVIGTYTGGPSIEVVNDVTRSKYVEMCRELSRHFGVPTSPEPVYEGGLCFKVTTGYKSFRHNLRYKCLTDGKFKWPHVPEDVLVRWSDLHDVVLLEKGLAGSSCLKSFDGAPAWTMEELRSMKAIMGRYGIVLRRMDKVELPRSR